MKTFIIVGLFGLLFVPPAYGENPPENQPNPSNAEPEAPPKPVDHSGEIESLKAEISALRTAVADLKATEVCDRECTYQLVQNARGPKLAGYHNVHFFLRSSDNRFRLSPRFRVQVDSVLFLPESDTPGTLTQSILVRRARPELSAGLFREYIQMHLSGELAGSRARIADAWIRVNPNPWFRFQLGQFSAPFSMENNVSDLWVDFMERSAVVRNIGYASKTTGAMILGGNDLMGYQLGAFNQDRPARNENNTFDVAARIIASPLARSSHSMDKLRVGASATVTDRIGSNTSLLSGAHGPGRWLRTSGGHSWLRTENSVDGLNIGIVPTGQGLRFGGEFDLPFNRFFFRGEFIHFRTDTDERDLDERTVVRTGGSLRANGAYLTLGVWLRGGRKGANGESIPRGGGIPAKGIIPLHEAPAPAIGTTEPRIQLALRGEWLNAKLDSGTAGDLSDGLGVEGDVTWFASSVGANVWWTKHFRMSANYTVNHIENAPIVELREADQNLLHEFGLRYAIQF